MSPIVFIRRITAVALAVIAALLVGCGSGEESEPAASGSDSSAPAATSNAASDLPDLSGQRLVFVNYGGETLDAIDTEWLRPFADATGAETATDSPTDPAKIKAMVEADRVTWDVVAVDPGVGLPACGTLFEKRQDVDMSEVDPDLVSDDCMVPVLLYAVSLIYNKEMFGDDPPTKITDFMDTERFPGKRLLFNYPVASVEPLLSAHGVAPEDIYPIDFDQVSEAYNAIKDDLDLQPEVALQQQSMETGDFAMCLCYTGRAAAAADNGADIGIVWDHTFMGADGLYAVKGSPNPDAQWAFMNYIAKPDVQAALSEAVPYAPTTPASEPDVGPTTEMFLPTLHTDEMNGPVLFDAAWWGENSDDALSQWTALTSG